MTRNELAGLEVKKVRSNANLFTLFKKYVTEDAPLLYASGVLPSGCFGCQFNKLFTKWRNLYLTQKTTTMASSEKKTYELKNKATKFYFKGAVLSSTSSDDAWLDWINYPADADKVNERKEFFSKLPSTEEDAEDAPVAEKETKKQTTKKSKKSE